MVQDKNVSMGVESQDTLSGRYLTFNVDDETYGIEIRYIIEIIVMHQVTVVPNVPSFIKGIFNMRGSMIPVIDARLKFGKQEIPPGDRTCIIVVELGSITLGFIVDSVEDVATIVDENIVPKPTFRNNPSDIYIKGVGKVNGTTKLLLDVEKLVYDGDIAGI